MLRASRTCLGTSLCLAALCGASVSHAQSAPEPAAISTSSTETATTATTATAATAEPATAAESGAAQFGILNVTTRVSEPVLAHIVEADGVTQSCQLPCMRQVAPGRVHIVTSGGLTGDFQADMNQGPLQFSLYPRSAWGVVLGVSLILVSVVPAGFGGVFIANGTSFSISGLAAFGTGLVIGAGGLLAGGIVAFILTGPGVEVSRPRFVPTASPLAEGGAVVGVAGVF